MKSKLVKNLSVNTLQLVINQVFSLGIFYVLSTGLDKNSFGQINLALAVLLTVFNILSCGIDQLVIKKIAGGSDPKSVIALYTFHVVTAGLLFYGLLSAGAFLAPGSSAVYKLILLIGIGKTAIFFSTPFKQAANGLEHFRLLAFMSVISNSVRCCALVILLLLHNLPMQNIIAVFIIGDIMELAGCVYLFKHATGIPVSIKLNKKRYLQLLYEALPQTGVVLITSALARFDWIFIGFMVSAIKLAEYSFAYKIFEISTLPLLAIAPLLIPRFTKLFQQTTVRAGGLKFLIRVELIIAGFIGLLLNMCWSPVIDGITAGKYGEINIKTIFILSLCMPLLYLNNFLWTIYFAQGRMKMILNSFMVTFFVNVAGDILLIPFFGNEGAAAAFFAACLVQAGYYMTKNELPELNRIWVPAVVATCCALTSGFIARSVFSGSIFMLPFGIAFYVILLFISFQIQIADGSIIRRNFIGE